MNCKSFKSRQNKAINPKNTSRTQVPRARLYQRPEGWSLQVALPGVTQDQISLEVEGRTLRLSARGERRHYRRSFRLPLGQDVEKIDASLEAGILSVQIKADAPLKRTVEVQVA